MYILNINKSYGTNTPQILGRVADLPYMDFEFMFKDGTKAVDLTGCTVEFRGTTPTYNKIISTDSVKVKDAKNGTIDFKIPKNFYSAPGAFKRAYFAIKKNGRIDTTQDVIIHVLDSVDMDAQDAQDVIDGLDQVIKEVTDKMNRETQAMVDAIQKEYDNLEALLQKQAEDNITKIDREIKVAIDESKLRMRQLESEYRGVINNAQLTLNQLKAEVDKLKPYVDETNKKLDELNAKLKKIQDDLDRTDLVTQGDLEKTTVGGLNLLGGSRFFDNPWRITGATTQLDEDGFTYVTIRNSYNKWVYQPYHNWVNGEKYILSFDACSDEDTVINPKVDIVNAPTWVVSIDSREFKRYQIPFTWDFDSKSASIQLLSRQDKVDVHVKKVKLERANFSSGWGYSGKEIVDIKDIDNLQKQIDELTKIVTALGGS